MHAGDTGIVWDAFYAFYAGTQSLKGRNRLPLWQTENICYLASYGTRRRRETLFPLSVLKAFSSQDCQEPRDKFYAFHALLPEDLRVKVDYTQSLADLVILVAHAMVYSNLASASIVVQLMKEMTGKTRHCGGVVHAWIFGPFERSFQDCRQALASDEHGRIPHQLLSKMDSAINEYMDESFVDSDG